METENKKSHNPSAFPIIEQHGDLVTWSTCEGMMLRDYFAAKAMQGFVANNQYSEMFSGNNGFPEPDFISQMSYLIADAMLKSRENV